MERFTGFKKIEDTAATPILRELSETMRDTGSDDVDLHPARTLKKMIFDTVSDPYLKPEEKWDTLMKKEEVHGMVAGNYRTYELAPETQRESFLLATLALFAEKPEMRLRPDVIAKVQDVWTSYAETSEVGHMRPPSVRPYSEEEKRIMQQRMDEARARLPLFLSITERLTDIVRDAPWANGYNMFEHYKQYIPELKDLK